MDKIVNLVLYLVSWGITLTSVILIVKAFVDIAKGKRTLKKTQLIKKLISIFFFIIYALVLGLSVKNLIDMKEVLVTENCIMSVLIAFSTFSLYYYITDFFKKEVELRLFAVVVIGVAGALAYSFIMFLINNTIQNASIKGYYFFFILSILTYVYAQRLTRTNMISFANTKVVEFRDQVFKIILNTSHEKLQKIEVGRIYTCINNDMEILGNSMRDIVTVCTNTITILVCFAYLAFLNFRSFLLAFAIFVLAVAFDMIFIKKQEKLFESLMIVQHKLYNLLESLINGHKELIINRKKRKEYAEDIQSENYNYKDIRVKVENSMTNTFVIGQVLIYIVIGIVIFVFPLIFEEIDYKILGSYAMTFVFIINPISYLVDLAPRAFQAKISYVRIKKLIEELSSKTDITDLSNEKEEAFQDIETIELRDIYYKYDNGEEDSFEVGPINCKFNKGNINFIIGGNGSGKSTISKIIIGLYKEKSGEVLVNGKLMPPEERCEYFSAVFSDYYLFKKIYGINTLGKDEVINEYLDKLRIKDKVSISNNELSTINLSSGQRKRIALLLCYLENKSIYLFDEWAADQDSEFREFFYLELLPEMKKQGKIVIAITHDDRYFNTADKIYKMDLGKISELNKEEM